MDQSPWFAGHAWPWDGRAYWAPPVGPVGSCGGARRHRQGCQSSPCLAPVPNLRLFDGVRVREIGLSLGQRDESLVVLMKRPHFFFGQILDIDEPAARPFQRRHQFVEFQMYGLGVLVLRPLDQEHHEECNDGRSGVDHQLPGVGEPEERSGQRPDDDDADRACERPGAPGSTWSPGARIVPVRGRCHALRLVHRHDVGPLVERLRVPWCTRTSERRNETALAWISTDRS